MLADLVFAAEILNGGQDVSGLVAAALDVLQNQLFELLGFRYGAYHDAPLEKIGISNFLPSYQVSITYSYAEGNRLNKRISKKLKPPMSY
jgi:hypothetical protein